ncbi:hypothetical protein M758_4G266800 [Ceratodon purpureus]|nr:hypothetical protein M758_4G266800 [Ceratodon purpureus]
MEPFNLALTPARKGACVVELWCKWWNGDTSTEGEMIFLEEEPLHGRAHGLRAHKGRVREKPIPSRRAMSLHKSSNGPTLFLRNTVSSSEKPIPMMPDYFHVERILVENPG